MAANHSNPLLVSAASYEAPSSHFVKRSQNALTNPPENFTAEVERVTIPQRRWFQSSASLRTQHIVELALNETDETLQSSVPSRSPSLTTSRRSLSSTSATPPPPHAPDQVPEFYQLRNQAQVDSEQVVSIDVESYPTSIGYGGVADRNGDTQHYTASQILSNLAAPVTVSTNQQASTHQLVSFAVVHDSAGGNKPNPSRTVRVSIPTEVLLDPEKGSDMKYSD
ncbi:hypothetical protein EVAR_60015_1 [Eumeta japonica]|uniref:Uncharacterized protein n=1 Tax=Eumeta variegata TaxID=151549 RepID=A0A4C1ZJI0_EUMVA|nr:hypothetical protein EVAR_60015_1 [Eumeta japonica]